MLIDQCKTVFGAAKLICRYKHMAYSAVAFACSEAVECVKDLAIESKMELEAEKAAVDQVRSREEAAIPLPVKKEGEYLH